LNESQPDDPYALIGTAVDAGGKFCMLLDYFQSFRFEVGCLQSIQ
jgi:hypothetical protein